MPRAPIYILIALFLAGGFLFLNTYVYNEKQVETPSISSGQTAKDYKDAEYIIERGRVKLQDGIAEMETAPGSASKIITRYFGNEVTADLNDDGREDVVFLLTQQTGGSGTFYYVVAALNTERGYVGSEALFLGDRIAPQTTEKGKGKIIVVNYADRAPGEDFSVQPSVGKSIWLLLDPETLQFGEVEQNFEGEADPSKMTLGMKSWVWLRAFYNDGKEIKPKQEGKFTITFSNDGGFTATTDCNRRSGNYTTNKNTISIHSTAFTEIFCEGSQEAGFAALLENTQNYHFTSRGELVFDLKFDSGVVVFR